MNPPTDSCNKSTYLGMILYPSIPRKRNLSVCWHEKEEKWATLKLKWFDVEMQRHAAKQSEVSPPAVLWTYRTEKPQQAQFLIYKMMLCTDLTYITELLWTTLRSDKEWGIIYLHHGRKSQRLSELKRRFQQHLYRNDPLNHDNLETVNHLRNILYQRKNNCMLLYVWNYLHDWTIVSSKACQVTEDGSA